MGRVSNLEIIHKDFNESLERLTKEEKASEGCIIRTYLEFVLLMSRKETPLQLTIDCLNSLVEEGNYLAQIYLEKGLSIMDPVYIGTALQINSKTRVQKEFVLKYRMHSPRIRIEPGSKPNEKELFVNLEVFPHPPSFVKFYNAYLDSLD
jgi:hypothetical protein